MSFFIHHRLGHSERDPPFSIFPQLLDEVDGNLDDEEHVSVSVVHESEWGLGFCGGGYVNFEHVEGEGEPRHMSNIPREKLLEMMEALAKGDLEAIEREPWQPGY